MNTIHINQTENNVLTINFKGLKTSNYVLKLNECWSFRHTMSCCKDEISTLFWSSGSIRTISLFSVTFWQIQIRVPSEVQQHSIKYSYFYFMIQLMDKNMVKLLSSHIQRFLFLKKSSSSYQKSSSSSLHIS